MKQATLLSPCGSNNAGTEEQNPTPTLLIVIILFSNHSMTDCHPRKLEGIYFFSPNFVKCLCRKNSVGIIVSIIIPNCKNTK